MIYLASGWTPRTHRVSFTSCANKYVTRLQRSCKDICKKTLYYQVAQFGKNVGNGELPHSREELIYVLLSNVFEVWFLGYYFLVTPQLLLRMITS